MKIAINLKCPVCQRALVFEKDEARAACSVRCPECHHLLKMKFDTSAASQEPQIFETVPPENESVDTRAGKKSRGGDTTYIKQSPGGASTTTGQIVPPPPPPPASGGQQPRKTVIVPPGRDMVPPPPRRDPEADYCRGNRFVPSGAYLLKKHFFRSERFDLGMGTNIVGRADSGQPSDISIAGDALVSRRSVAIAVTRERYGIEARLKVLKALNPVKVNGLTVYTGQETLLSDGDKIILGETTLQFKQR